MVLLLLFVVPILGAPGFRMSEDSSESEAESANDISGWNFNPAALLPDFSNFSFADSDIALLPDFSNLTVNAPVNLTLPNLPAFGLLPGIAGAAVFLSQIAPLAFGALPVSRSDRLRTLELESRTNPQGIELNEPPAVQKEQGFFSRMERRIESFFEDPIARISDDLGLYHIPRGFDRLVRGVNQMFDGRKAARRTRRLDDVRNHRPAESRYSAQEYHQPEQSNVGQVYRQPEESYAAQEYRQPSQSYIQPDTDYTQSPTNDRMDTASTRLMSEVLEPPFPAFPYQTYTNDLREDYYDRESYDADVHDREDNDLQDPPALQYADDLAGFSSDQVQIVYAAQPKQQQQQQPQRQQQQHNRARKGGNNP